MPRKKPKPASYEGKKPNNYRELNLKKNKEINVVQENQKQGRMKPKSVFEGYNSEKKKDKKKKQTKKKKPTTKPKTQRVKQTPMPKSKY